MTDPFDPAAVSRLASGVGYIVAEGECEISETFLKFLLREEQGVFLSPEIGDLDERLAVRETATPPISIASKLLISAVVWASNHIGATEPLAPKFQQRNLRDEHSFVSTLHPSFASVDFHIRYRPGSQFRQPRARDKGNCGCRCPCSQ
jgi:hypothetical protein